MEHKPHLVFEPGLFPTSTYVSRDSDWEGTSYEDRLQLALNTSGFLTVVAGPSKSGKTTLCHRVVSQGLIDIAGSDFHSVDEFWREAACCADLALDRLSVSSKDAVIYHYNSQNSTLLISHFQDISSEIRKVMVQQLKDAAGKGLRIIVTMLPHQVQEMIRLNPDLSGRISIIQLRPWNTTELAEIAASGFRQLRIQCSNDLLQFLAEESLSSPGLIQAVCHNIELLLIQSGSVQDAVLDRKTCIKALQQTASTPTYQKAAQLLKAGPVQKRAGRTKYLLHDGSSKDLYELILKALATDPPAASIQINALYNRILASIVRDSQKKPTLSSLRRSLNSLLKLTDQQGTNLCRILDFHEDTLCILDPQFLFDLRWNDRLNF